MLGDDWILPSAKSVLTINYAGKVVTARTYLAFFTILDSKEDIFWEKVLSRILITDSGTGLIGMDVLKYFKWGGENEVFRIETL